jgi:hypothetical protein
MRTLPGVDLSVRRTQSRVLGANVDRGMAVSNPAHRGMALGAARAVAVAATGHGAGNDAAACIDECDPKPSRALAVLIARGRREARHEL